MLDVAEGLKLLIVTAASVGFFHTLMGPDHYVPFIVMARARKWSAPMTAWVTVLCGIGHVLSSVILGFLGIALGVAVTKLTFLETLRGNLAGWTLIMFGLVYCVWGVRRAIRNKPHEHVHFHEDDEVHSHTHIHHKDHVHIHAPKESRNLTPWILFTIFIFGPCEPLIPLLMYPAAKGSYAGVIWVTAVFGVVTIVTMLGMVMVSSMGLNLVPLGRLERFSHALAGATICMCGLAIQFLGL
ncbi:MAG TPA: sulfite exporter TauE/SafE family protein [Syntrophorhabdaceae bacterium]